MTPPEPMPEPMVIGPITRTDIVRYQGASGDMNPVHHDEGFAADSGFDKPLGIGMLPVGFMATWATNWLGPENVRKTRVRFKQPYFPGDTLTITGQVTNQYQENGEDRVDVELSVTHADGRVAIQGWMTFVVPKE
jgi:acyl dehydratase